MADPNVTPLFAAQQPDEEARMRPMYLDAVRAAIDMASARSLSLIALLGAVGIWTWATYDPAILRLWAAGGYSVGVLLPTIVLSWKRG